ncbi:MAG: phenylalanine--tRNA ligase subunit beta [Cytophagaceae bacterium]|jgi:phenylalanyl-tRNA synthetase beta chain|nr:phenylalanine--tRNA ligase subunit beta [Cytophagaceae bacterium]
MKIAYNWLKQFIDISESPEEIGALLTKSGLEVEKIERFETIKGGLEGLVVGKVLSVLPHPNADRLRLTTVDIGEDKPLAIVCGAPNVAVDQTVIVATIGATLYPSKGDAFTIQKSKIRGEVSEGMLCGADEIGVEGSTEGIIVLDASYTPGTPAKTVYKVTTDTIFEIGLTPNRSDAASHLGVARDLKALLRRNLKSIDIKGYNPGFRESGIKVKVENTKACPKYTGLVISNVTVKASPDWLKQALQSIGVNSINNVVDVTNYVLHSLGQPLHAFDLDEVKGSSIVIKNSTTTLPFTLLDGSVKQITDQDVLIYNASEPMCLAGIMGGKESGVTTSTQHIFLECAYFSAETVRSSSMRHGIKTDSSFRFERGTDPNICITALKKAAALIVEVAGGEISSDIIDTRREAFEPFKIETTHKRICQLIGKEIPSDTIIEILSYLDIKLAFRNGELLVFEVPRYRVDVQREADLVEEILRIYGYDNIELSAHLNTNFIAPYPEKNTRIVRKRIEQLLIGKGFHEIMGNSLTRSSYIESAGLQDAAVPILNKLSEELAYMRPSMVFSGLDAVAYNINRKQKDLALYEIGKIYTKKGSKYIEQNRLSIFLTGNQFAESWQAKSVSYDFFDLKNIIVQFLEIFHLQPTSAAAIEGSSLIDTGIEYKDGVYTFITLGYISKPLLKAADIKQDVLYASIDLDWVLKLYTTQASYKEIPKFPEVRRDLSLVVDKKVTYEEIKEIALKTEKRILQSVTIFDIYEGEKMASGKKSYSISFQLIDKEQTLTDETIDQTMNKLMAQFEKQLGADIRK